MRLRGLQELAVSGLDDVRLRDHGYSRLALLARIFERHLDDALAALAGDSREVESEVFRHMDAAAAHDVGAFRVLAEERPVDALRRYFDRPHVGEEVERAAHGNVCAFNVRPGVAGARRGRRRLEDDVALLQLFEHVVWNGFELRGPVLDRQAVDDAEDDVAPLGLRLEEELQHALRFPRDVGADAVAAADADDERLDGRVVDPAVVRLHVLDSC